MRRDACGGSSSAEENPVKPTYKVGDVIRRVRGVVPMAIESDDGKRVSCVWFAKNKHGRWTGPYRKRFKHDEIVLVRRRRTPRSAR